MYSHSRAFVQTPLMTTEPSALDRLQAQQLKAMAESPPVPLTEESMAVIPADTWFRPTANNYQFIPLESLWYHADKDFEKWNKVHRKITHECNASEQLINFLRTSSVEHLSQMLSETPDGLVASDIHAAFTFTKCQRIHMHMLIDMPYSITSSVHISGEDLQELAYPRVEDRKHGRKEPFGATYSLLEHSFPSMVIINHPTGTGKTAFSLAVGLMAVSSQRFPKLVETYRNRQVCEIVQGPAYLPVARLIIVATPGNTMNHFHETLLRLLPAIRKMDPATRYEVWKTMSKHNTVEVAANLPADTALIWFVPMADKAKVLKKFPRNAVAVCLQDEYTIDTPRTQSKGAASTVIKDVIMNATPQDLVQATGGHSSSLKEKMGGQIISPKDIGRLIKYREWSKVQLALDQLCKLDLCMLTSWRPFLRWDLKDLVPRGMDIFFAPSRRTTLASHLLGSSAELVPCDFKNVLLSMLRRFPATDASLHALHLYLRENDGLDLEVLATHLQNLVHKPEINFYDKELIPRLITRIKDYKTQCPICFCEPDPSASFASQMRLFGCCSYTTCKRCYDRCNACPFCRKAKPDALLRDSVPGLDVVETGAASTAPTQDALIFSTEFPDMPMEPVWHPEDTTVKQTMARYSKKNHTQMTNLVLALFCLKRHGYNRILVLVQAYNELAATVGSNKRIMDALQFTGITPLLCSNITGVGTKFTAVKKAFDAPGDDTRAFVNISDSHNSLMTGTDFTTLRAILCVGDLPWGMYTQAIFRGYRPNAGRDNSVPLAFVSVTAK